MTVARIGLALLPVLAPALGAVVAHRAGDHGDPVPGLLATVVLLLLAFARAARLQQDQVALRASLRSQTRYFSALAAHSSDAVVVLDRQGGLTHDSAELARLLGEAPLVPAGGQLIDVAVFTDRDEVEDLLRRALDNEGSAVAAELRSQVDPERPRWFGVRMVGLTEDPDVAGVVVTVHEVTDRILAQQEIAHNALHDGLTGLANRALFDDRLDQALRRAERSGDWPVVRLAIDDFGTGYSSLSYLRSFPVDILEVDRSFVAMITEHEAVPPILRGLIELARTLGLELVAEGVETETQHERLRAERCELAQGYLYAAPLDVDEAERLILALVAAPSAGTAWAVPAGPRRLLSCSAGEPRPSRRRRRPPARRAARATGPLARRRGSPARCVHGGVDGGGRRARHVCRHHHAGAAGAVRLDA